MPLFLFFNIAFNIHSHYFCAHEHYQLLLHHNHEEKKFQKIVPSSFILYVALPTQTQPSNFFKKT